MRLLISIRRLSSEAATLWAAAAAAAAGVAAYRQFDDCKLIVTN